MTKNCFKMLNFKYNFSQGRAELFLHVIHESIDTVKMTKASLQRFG